MNGVNEGGERFGMRRIDPEFWAGRSVFITGHMGFKGVWLAHLLSRLGARVTGYGCDARVPLLFNEVTIDNLDHVEGDICDLPAMSAALVASQAEVLFHLAAQPIVLSSYEAPVETFTDNIIGTANVLQAARFAPNLRSLVVVTSDKVYRNNEWVWAYRESEPLGGKDPYSASKAAAEIVTQSMIASFFSAPGSVAVATARAGNVIGGGDWADFRLLPDAARAFIGGNSLVIRHPGSVRPWQHVLEPLSGYVMLAESLSRGEAKASNAWNFGPAVEDAIPVASVAEQFVRHWGEGVSWRLSDDAVTGGHEAGFLAVDSSLARRQLGWLPRWRVGEALARTAHWYRDHAGGADARTLMDRDIDDYLKAAGAQV